MGSSSKGVIENVNDKAHKRSPNFKAQMPNKFQSSKSEFDIGILAFGFDLNFGFWHLEIYT
jgi:hypothetical protein